MVRRRSVPWIYRWSRVIIGAIAIFGALITAYLTITKLMGAEAVCLASAAPTAASCTDVLNSKYAYLFGLPLSIFGLLAYLSMATFSLSPLFVNGEEQKDFRSDLEKWTWLLLFIGATAMVVFSGYLMSLLIFEFKAFCLYCITSAISSTSMFVLTIMGRDWEDSGQLFFTGIIVLVIISIFSVWHYKNANIPDDNHDETVVIPIETQLKNTPEPTPPKGWEIITTSGNAEIDLAQHLTKTGAIMYGAWWCGHCHEQKLLLGKEAFSKINYIECAEKGTNPQPDVCTKAGVKGFPTWAINNKIESGVQTGKKLAKLSGYTGKTNFKYKLAK